MRGEDAPDGNLFSYVSLEKRVRADHPLRQIRIIVDDCLMGMDDLFSGLYARVGRPSIAAEKLIRALLCQAFFSVRSERQLMEQMGYNLLFRWFVGMGVDDPVWDASTFSKNRDRLLDGDVAQAVAARAGAMRTAISMETHTAMTRTPARPIRMRGCTRRAKAARRYSATWVMPSPRTVTGSRWQAR
jgi:transposase